MQRVAAALDQEAADAREAWINASPANKAAATAAYENKMLSIFTWNVLYAAVAALEHQHHEQKDGGGPEVVRAEALRKRLD